MADTVVSPFIWPIGFIDSMKWKKTFFSSIYLIHCVFLPEADNKPCRKNQVSNHSLALRKSKWQSLQVYVFIRELKNGLKDETGVSRKGIKLKLYPQQE